MSSQSFNFKYDDEVTLAPSFSDHELGNKSSFYVRVNAVYNNNMFSYEISKRVCHCF